MVTPLPPKTGLFYYAIDSKGNKMNIEFNLTLKVNGKENITRTVEFADDSKRAEILAVQMIKQLENAKLDAEFRYVYEGLKGGVNCSSGE